MKLFKKPQFIVIGFAVFLVVLLLLLPRTGKKVEKPVEEDVVSSDYTSSAINALDEPSSVTYKAIVDKISTLNDPLEKITWYDSLSHFWDVQGNLLLSGDALNEIALMVQDKPSYFIAGDKYFEAFQAGAETEKTTALRKAIASYNEVLELNSEDLEAMTSLGVCYVEGAALLGEQPMKGIQMLRDVLAKDPDNINAMVNLGYFAVKSGQFDKAIERFEKVLELDPAFADAHLYLSDVYLKMGDKNKALEQLEKYKLFMKDPEALKQLENYIDKVKNSNV